MGESQPGFYEWYDGKKNIWVPCECYKISGELWLVKGLVSTTQNPYLINRELLSLYGTHAEKNEYVKAVEAKWLR